MTVFNVFDESGRIVQSNKIFSPAGYADVLRERGHQFVEHDSSRPLNSERFHVSNGAIADRPEMGIQINRTEIQAGGSDAAIVSGAPQGAVLTISTSGLQIWSGVVPPGPFEISIPVPCVYRLRVDKWPFQTFHGEVRGMQ